MSVTSRLSFASRTLLGPWLLLVALPLEVVNALQRSIIDSGETMWTLDWMGVIIFIIGPLAAGIAAEDAARTAQPSRVYMLVASRPARVVLLRAASWTAGPLILVHVATYLVSVVIGGSSIAAMFTPRLLVGIATQVASIVWFVALGSLVGRYARPLIAGVAAVAAAAVLTFALNGSTKGTPSFELLWLGGATFSRVGFEYSLRYLTVQTVVLLASAVVVFFMPVRIRRLRLRPDWSTAVGIGLAGAIIIAAQIGGPDTRNQATYAPPTNCFEWEPTICTYAEYGADSELIAQTTKALYDDAVKAGYGDLVPERVEQVAGEYSPSDPAVVTLTLTPQDLEGNWVPELLITDLAYPNCPELKTDEFPPGAFWRDYDLVVGSWAEVAGYDGADLVDDPASIPASPGTISRIADRWSRCEIG